MWSPPMCTLRSGLRAWRSNSRGAFATCSSRKSGSSFTRCPETSWPARRKSSRASSLRNSTPSSETIRRQPPSSVAIASSERISYRGIRLISTSAASLVEQPLERGLEPAARPSRAPRAAGRAARLRAPPAGAAPRSALREPDDPRVVAEVVVAELRVAVEPEPAHDDAVEAADEEVGQVVGAGLVVQRARPSRRARSSGRPRAARSPSSAPRVPQSAYATTHVGRRRPPSRPPRGSARAGCAARAAADAPRASQPRRRAIASTWSASAPQATTTRVMPGTPSWSTNRSLKSVRPESST